MKDKPLEVTSLAMANSISVAMQNATNCQQNAQHIINASVAACCVGILKAGNS